MVFRGDGDSFWGITWAKENETSGIYFSPELIKALI